MSKLHLKAPSPALVISIIALFAALGGTSYAALANGSVGTAQLKNKAVTNAKLGKQSVGTAKLRPGSVTTTNIATGAVTTGQLGNAAVTTGQLADNSVTTTKIVNNAVTSTKIGPGQVRAGNLASATQSVSASVPIAATSGGFTTVTCPAGTRVLSGGGGTNSFLVDGVESFQNGNGWLWAAFNRDTAAHTIFATAVCLAQ